MDSKNRCQDSFNQRIRSRISKCELATRKVRPKPNALLCLSLITVAAVVLTPAVGQAAGSPAGFGKGSEGAAGRSDTDSPAVWIDAFDTEMQEPTWFWINENPEGWSLSENPGFLRIYASANPTGGENLLLRAISETDFSVETHLLFEPFSNFQFAGLVVYQDEANFLQLGRAFCDVEDACIGSGIYFDNIQGGEWMEGNYATEVNSSSEAYLRLERRGDMVRAFYSSDGANWFEIGTHWIPSEFQANSVGLTASQDYDPSEPIFADFDYFELTEGGGFFPEGYHDYEQGDVPNWACSAGGWAADPDDRAVNLQVRIVVDDGAVATVPANQFREDLLEAGVCEEGECGFEVGIWDLTSPYESHTILTYAQDFPTEEWVRLSSSPKELTCRSYDIYLFDTKTSAVRQVSSLEDSWEFNPRWSPDGKRIVHDRWALDFSSHGIHITDVESGATIPLIGGQNGNYPSWSPNGKWIAFSRDDTGVFVVPAEGGSSRLVREDAFMPSWSPNSRRLAFQQPSDGSIQTMDINGQDAISVVAIGEAPAWSPNGHWIAYQHDGDLWKVRVDIKGRPLGDPIQLTSDPAWEDRPSWSADSRTIVFHAGYDDDTDIWMIPAIGGLRTRLVGGAGFDDYDPNFSNNGGSIAFSGYTPNAQTYFPVPRIVASPGGDWLWTTDFRPGSLSIAIYASQDPSADLLWEGTKDADESGFAIVELSDHGIDLLPGYLLVVADRLTEKQLVLEDISLDVFDTEQDILSGYAPPHRQVWVAAGPQDWQEGMSVRSKGNTGEWEADFASVGFDITEDMRGWSYAQIFDEDGDANEAGAPPNPHFTVFPEWKWFDGYDWPDGPVGVSVANKGECTTSGDSLEGFFNGGFPEGCDLAADDEVSFFDGTTTRTHTVRDLAVLTVDGAENTVAGMAEAGAEIVIWVHEHDGSEMRLPADDGTWLADFDDIDFPLEAGMCGRAEIRDDQANSTAVDWCVPNTRFTVFPEWNYLEGYEWPDAALVSISVAGKGDCSTEATAGYPDWDPWNTFFSVDLPENCSLEDGDLVTLSADGLSLTHEVQGLAVTTVDIETDTVVGTADFDPGLYMLHTWIHDIDDSYMQMTAPEGIWVADFGDGGFDLEPGMGGRVELVDGYSNATAVDWNAPPALGLRVNYGHDWVESFYEEGHTIGITLTEADGETVKATATAFTEPKEYWGGESGFTTNETGWDGPTPDLQPGDWLFAVLDNGVTAEVKLGTIEGEVDISSDSVTGTIEAAWIGEAVPVECLDWGSELAEPVNKDAGFISPNGADELSCNWDPETEWDLQPWQEVGVAYFTPDGHWVANAFRAEHWLAIWTYDLDAETWSEGDHTYYFEWNYTVPPPGAGGSMDPVSLAVDSQANAYPGYVLLWSREALSPLAWTGDTCEVVASIRPDQPTRFAWGWVNDYSMSLDEALEHFNSFGVSVFWNGALGGAADLTRGDLVQWYGPSSSDEYRCALTENP